MNWYSLSAILCFYISSIKSLAVSKQSRLIFKVSSNDVNSVRAAATATTTVKCSTCIQSKVECLGRPEIEDGCEFCLLVKGKITEPRKIPGHIEGYVSDVYPQISLKKNQPVIARMCMNSRLVEMAGFEALLGCIQIKSQQYGMTGRACLCKGDC